MSANPNPTGMAGKIDMTLYCGDDYDRAGCRAAIDVTEHGYRLSTYAPNGARMESYRTVKSAAAAGRMLVEWLNGSAPRLPSDDDQDAVAAARAALSCYPLARLRGTSQGIRGGSDHVKLSFDLEGGQIVRMRVAPDEMRYIALYYTLVCMGLPRGKFEAVIDGIQPLHSSHISRSGETPSAAADPNGVSSV